MLLFVVERTECSPHGLGIEVLHGCRGALHIAQGNLGLVLLAVAEIGHFHLVAGTVVYEHFLQLAELFNLLAVDGRNHVAFLQAGRSRSAFGSHFVHVDAIDRAEVHLVALFLLGIDIGRHVCTRNAEQGTLHGAVFLEVINHLVHDGSGDGKAVARVGPRLGIEHGVDAHQFAAGVHQCATRVAGIDGGIGLDETLNAAGRGTQAAGLGADNACRDGGGEAEGVADGQYPFAQLQVIGIGHLDGLQSVGFNLDEGKVGGLVETNDAGLEFTVVVEFHGEFVGILHHVVVRNDVAVCTQYDARTGTRALGGLYLALLVASATPAKEVAKEIFKGVSVLDGLHLAVDGHLNIDHRVHCILCSVCQIYWILGRCSGGCRLFASKGQAEGQSQNGENVAFHE